MHLILLAGGKSTRMDPITDKMLLEFMGKPLLVHQIELLQEQGLTNIIIVSTKDNLADIESLNTGLKIVLQEEDTGMKGALMACESLLGGQSCLIVSSNDFVEPKAFSAILDTIHKEDPDGALVCREVESYFPGGYIELESGSQKIKNIVEKPKPGTEPSSLINLVIHYHKSSDKLFEALKKTESKNDDLYEQALATLFLSQNYLAVPYQGVWYPIKYPWHVLELCQYFLKQITEPIISPDASVSPLAHVVGPVIIEAGVKVFEFAVIKGPCYIGRNTVIANQALIRDSMIHNNCVIGFGSEVARSYLRHDIWTHTNYLGDSVIDSNVSFGAGCVTGTFRLDEKGISMNIKNEKTPTGRDKLGVVIGKNVRIGINSSLMPGIKIGPNSLLGAATLVAEDIPAQSYVRSKSELKISQNTLEIAPKNRGSFVEKK